MVKLCLWPVVLFRRMRGGNRDGLAEYSSTVATRRRRRGRLGGLGRRREQEREELGDANNGEETLDIETGRPVQSQVAAGGEGGGNGPGAR